MTTLLEGHQPLIQPADSDHMVYIWHDIASLSEAVNTFVMAGLQENAGIILIATPDHSETFTRALLEKGIDVEGLTKSGQIRMFDAEKTLNKFMIDGMPDKAAFNEVVGGLLEKAKAGPFSSVRAYGEMVNLLWEGRNLTAAICLEQLWNELATRYSFSLLCGYRMDGFDDEVYNGALQSVCKTHSHFIPTKNHGQFKAAIERALEEIFGESAGTRLATLAHRNNDDERVRIPAAQRYIFWIKENMPGMCEKILLRARHHFGTLAEETAV